MQSNFCHKPQSRITLDGIHKHSITVCLNYFIPVCSLEDTTECWGGHKENSCNRENFPIDSAWKKMMYLGKRAFIFLIFKNQKMYIKALCISDYSLVSIRKHQKLFYRVLLIYKKEKIFKIRVITIIVMSSSVCDC